MYNPVNFKSIKGFMKRKAKKMGNHCLISNLKVDGVRPFNLNELRILKKFIETKMRDTMFTFNSISEL